VRPSPSLCIAVDTRVPTLRFDTNMPPENVTACWQTLFQTSLIRPRVRLPYLTDQVPTSEPFAAASRHRARIAHDC